MPPRPLRNVHPPGREETPTRTLAASSTHGEGASAWWLFEPDDPPAKGSTVVLFLHGWIALDPWVYGAWIRHLVRRGHTVVFPKYQSSAFTPPSAFLPAIQEAVRGFIQLRNSRGSDAGLMQWAVAGHSAGGLLAVNYASACAAAGLPAPRSVLCIEPGRTPSQFGGPGIPLASPAAIDPRTLLLTIAGDRDHVCGQHDARLILEQTTAIPSDRRAFVLVRSDNHGSPGLAATHFSPCSVLPETTDVSSVSTPGSALLAAAAGDLQVMRGFLATEQGREWLQSPDRPELAESFEEPDASDWLLWWRLLDIVLEEAFQKEPRGPADLDARIRNAGRWSDGTPVRPPVIFRP